jgi:putative transposase
VNPRFKVTKQKKSTGDTTMKENNNQLPFPQGINQDPLTDILRRGAQKMLAIALEAEIEAYIETHQSLQTSSNHRGVVRVGYHKERDIQTSMGPISVKVPRAKNRTNHEIEEFSSTLIPKYLRKSLSLEEAIPYFYLAGLSNHDFIPCFEKLYGNNTSGFSSTSITRLKKQWIKQHEKWKATDLSAKKYCYLWADGIHFNLRLEDSKLCVLVIIGAREDGVKELVAVEGGFRESTESWKSVLQDLKNRGMGAPKLCIGDGALGFWAALRDVYPSAKEQRCWVHKTGNVLDKLPKHLQPKAKGMLHEIYMCDTEKMALKNYEKFMRTFKDKYPNATLCLKKSKDELFTFFAFPGVHWQHIRSTNVIESMFATIRLRTKKTRGQGTTNMTLAMVFKLAERAQKKWRKLKGHSLIEKVISGVQFKDGEIWKQAA